VLAKHEVAGSTPVTRSLWPLIQQGLFIISDQLSAICSPEFKVLSSEKKAIVLLSDSEFGTQDSALSELDAP
jgi:hypothetical protein